jgi:Leucine Rich Repeat
MEIPDESKERTSPNIAAFASVVQECGSIETSCKNGEAVHLGEDQRSDRRDKDFSQIALEDFSESNTHGHGVLQELQDAAQALTQGLDPMWLTNLTRQARHERPGAFRVYPNGICPPSQPAVHDANEAPVEFESITATTGPGSQVVLEATLVEQGSCNGAIQHAAEVDSSQRDKIQILRRRAVAFVAAAALCCITGSIVGKLASGRNKAVSADYEAISFEQFRGTRLSKDSLQRAAADPQSPQAEALRWLDASSGETSIVAWRLFQRYALAVVYFALHGEGWVNNTGWLADPSECSWWSRMEPRPCDDNDRYISLSGFYNNMTGSIPPEIGLLSFLRTVDLSDNVISGHLPLSLGILTGLERLHLVDNVMSGPIPTEIGLLQHLGIVDLTENGFTGSIPTEIGNLRQTKFLSLSKNMLTGSIPEQIGLLEDADTVLVDNNVLNGTIPISLANMTSVKIMMVGTNQLSGTIPSEIALLKNLEVLWLAGNPITGTIPPSFGDLPLLEDLILDETLITGTIPPQL